MNPKVIAGSIAYVLLLLYALSIGYMIWQVLDCEGDACKSITFNSGMIYCVTLVGGLVSALVIAKLAATSPGGPVTMTSSESEVQAAEKNVAAAYVIVWFLVGLASFVVGEVFHPNISVTLSDIGKTWLGIAISAAYSYFGINANKGNK
jgi:hypothetical protein